MFRLSKNDCYNYLVRGAVAGDHAVAGIWFGLAPNKRSFIIEGQYALTPAMRTFVATLRPGDGSAAGNAIMQRHRVVIRDVEEDYANILKDGALVAGIRAATATPLIDSNFHAVGVISLYHSKPHHPSYHAAQALDACCRVASQVQEAFARYDTGVLSSAGQQAAAVVARLLPTCGQTDDESVYRTLSRHLDIVLKELPAPLLSRARADNTSSSVYP